MAQMIQNQAPIQMSQSGTEAMRMIEKKRKIKRMDEDHAHKKAEAILKMFEDEAKRKGGQ